MAQQQFKSPLSQLNNMVYEKPDVDDEGFYDRYKEGYTIDNDELKINKGRMDDIIDYYGVWNDNSDYSKGYMGFIDPSKFVEATTDDPSLIESETEPLDMDKLNNTKYHPFLQFKRDGKGNVYIVGHEGRHRLTALSKAGVKKVPIVFRDESSDYQKYNSKPIHFKGTFGGQKFSDTLRGKSIDFDDLELTPINYKNAATLWSKFGYNK